ncbi:hypothetical protein [Lentzea sp. NPDC059081]|uniref:hypothetical protein n=1 Tax=Lentzea sp. NPDC059081 TaxID=3346719 RepID=UPI0036C2ED2D
MPTLLTLAASMLVSAALAATPAPAAEPATATADFQQALFTPVGGVLDLEETPDGIKVAGEFRTGFASEVPSDYRLQVLDGAAVVLDLSEDFEEVAEIEAAGVAEFEFTTKTKLKIADLRDEDVVVRQLVDLAGGVKVQAEIGRAKIEKN